MPRGVYDRSKFKKKAGRAVKADAPKRKYTRRASNDESQVEDKAIKAIHKAERAMKDVQGTGQFVPNTFDLERRLNTVGALKTTNPKLQERIDEILIKTADALLTSLDEGKSAPVAHSQAPVEVTAAPKKAGRPPKAEKAEKQEEVKAEASSESKNGTHTVLPAPVPFIPIPTSSI